MNSIPFVPLRADRKPSLAGVCRLIQVHYSPPAANDPERGDAPPVTTPTTVAAFKPRIVQ